MDQTSSFASSPLLTTVQITAAVALVVGIFAVSTRKSDQVHTRTDTFSVDRVTSNGNRDALAVGTPFQTDSAYDSQRTPQQCKFEGENWGSPTTKTPTIRMASTGLEWSSNVHSNVDNNRMEATGPLLIQPLPRIAQLPDDFPQSISTADKELRGWGTLTAEEVEMINRQRESDVGLKSIEEIENDFPADASPEASLDTAERDRVDAEESIGILVVDEPSGEEVQADEFPVEQLLETETLLTDPVFEDSTSESADEEEFETYFIPIQELPTDEPERTPEQKERDDLKLAPLPKFKQSNDFLGEFDEPVVAIKDLPGLKGEKKKSKFPKLNKVDPTWWAAQIHQPQFAGRQQLETTLDEVIFMALRAAPQIQVLNTRPQIQRAVLNEANADFDWSAFVNSTWNDINDPIGSTLTAGGTANQFIQREWVFESGLRKRLRSGGDLTIGQNFGTLDSNSTFLTPDNQGNSRLVLDYRQPLLRGAGPSFNTSQIALADLDLQTIGSESLAELQNYLVEVVSAYWNIYFQRAALVQNRQSVRLAEELLRQLESRKGIDVRNDQLLRAEAAVGSRRSAMIRSEYDLINAQDTLINLVMGAKSETVDQVELLPEPMMLPMGYRVESEQLVQAAIRNRPEVRASIAQIRSSAIRKQIAANQLLPQLDAVLSSYISGLRGDRDIGGSFSDQFTTGEPSYTFGVQFEIPLGNRAAKSRLQRSQYEAQVFHREFERQVGDVVLEARIAGREIERLNRENENNFAALQKAAQELDLIQQRQLLSLDDSRTGSLYIEDLLASQGRLTAAESRLAQSQTSLAVALIDLKRATGELLSSGENAHQVSYEAVPFEGVSLDGVPIEDMSIEDMSIEGVPLEGAPLEGAPLEGAPLESFFIEEAIIEPAAPIDFQYENQHNNFGFPAQ